MTTIFQAFTLGELKQHIAAMDITVPLRTEGRTKFHTERFCIAYLLSSMPRLQKSFPFSLEHGDRPDFVLVGEGASVGIEHTEAVPENKAHSDAIRERGEGPEIHFIQPAMPGEPKRTATVLREEIERDDPGDGWVGDDPEREWADAMLHFAEAKAKKATSPGFARHEANWLLTYDNWPLPTVKKSLATRFLDAKLGSSQVFSAFDTVFVLDSVSLCEFRQSEPCAVHAAKVHRLAS